MQTLSSHCSLDGANRHRNAMNASSIVEAGRGILGTDAYIIDQPPWRFLHIRSYICRASIPFWPIALAVGFCSSLNIPPTNEFRLRQTTDGQCCCYLYSQRERERERSDLANCVLSSFAAMLISSSLSRLVLLTAI